MNELALLQNCLIVGAMLFGLGLIGFISRRNVIIMFLSAEIMLQGVSLSLIAWGRYHNNPGGQLFTLFIIAIAACEAAVALALILTLFHRYSRLDVFDWQSIREANQPPFVEKPLPPEPDEPEEPLPHLVPAGIRPDMPPEEKDYRRIL